MSDKFKELGELGVSESKKSKSHRIILVSLIIILILSACYFFKTREVYKDVYSLDDGIVVKEIDIDRLRDKKLNDFITENNLANGVFEYYYSKGDKHYILFNGVENIYKNVTFNLENKIFTISYESQSTSGNSKLLYLIEKESGDAFDTIKLLNNNKEDYFINVYTRATTPLSDKF